MAVSDPGDPSDTGRVGRNVLAIAVAGVADLDAAALTSAHSKEASQNLTDAQWQRHAARATVKV